MPAPKSRLPASRGCLTSPPRSTQISLALSISATSMASSRGSSVDSSSALRKRGLRMVTTAALPSRLHREGKAAVVTMRNPRFLNAEDESTLEPLELAIDVALMDKASEICVLRGGEVRHPRDAGKRLFGAGINLTHLYQGKIRYLWYLLRDLGLVNKLYRGLARPDASPEVASFEKLWIGAIEGFAIGGHCQVVLALDYMLALEDAYMTLPARKEGIIPGAANPRLTG